MTINERKFRIEEVINYYEQTNNIEIAMRLKVIKSHNLTDSFIEKIEDEMFATI